LQQIITILYQRTNYASRFHQNVRLIITDSYYYFARLMQLNRQPPYLTIAGCCPAT